MIGLIGAKRGRCFEAMLRMYGMAHYMRLSWRKV
jgi:hypothetical protein